MFDRSNRGFFDALLRPFIEILPFFMVMMFLASRPRKEYLATFSPSSADSRRKENFLSPLSAEYTSTGVSSLEFLSALTRGITQGKPSFFEAAFTSRISMGFMSFPHELSHF